MKKIIRYLGLYKIFLVQYIKSLMQSKVDFFIGLFAFLFTQISGIVFLQLIFSHIPSLNGWSLHELIFIYGFAQLPRAIDHLFTDYLWIFASSGVRMGLFDKYLLRPINHLFQIVAERFQPDAFGELIVGIVLVSYASVKLDIQITPLKIVLFIISVLAGAVIYTSIKLFFTSLAFWIKDSQGILQVAYEPGNFAKYPITIYSKPIQFILCFVLPYGFAAFFPASYFLQKETFLKSLGIEVIIAIVFFFISYKFFKIGTNSYESAGN